MTDTTTDRGQAPDGEDREQLEAERDFLLRSLDDLEAERAAGGIDDESYQTLHDDYTARAAAVIRALRDGIDSRPDAAPVSWKRRALVIGGVSAFAIVVALGLAAALGARLPGSTSSGNTGASAPADKPVSSAASLKRLEQAVAKSPNDVNSRFLLATFLEAKGDLAGALKQYDAIAQIDPTDARAEAQAGRVLYLAAEQLVKSSPDQAATLVNQAKARLDHSLLLDGNFADAYYFRAIVLANEFLDLRGAQSDLQHYRVLAPDGQFTADATRLLTDVTNAIESPTLPSSTTSPKRSK